MLLVVARDARGMIVRLISGSHGAAGWQGRDASRYLVAAATCGQLLLPVRLVPSMDGTRPCRCSCSNPLLDILQLSGADAMLDAGIGVHTTAA